MVSIVTGKINSGKTSFMLAYYQGNPSGDGFVSLKTMKEGIVQKYDAFQLSSGEKTLLAIHERYLEHQDIQTKIGPYCFLKTGLDQVESKLEEMIETRTEPIYLDEIGQLELNSSGFARILQKMVDSKLDLVLSIRKDLIPQVITKFKMEETQVITEL